MVFAVRPVRLLPYRPLPVPSVVWLPLKTGLGDVLQQTPRAVIGTPPLSVILPPLAAVVDVIEVAGEVITVGILERIFSNCSSFWQLKVIVANRKMQRKVFMTGVV